MEEDGNLGINSAISNPLEESEILIILITDGYPTDDFDSAIESLNSNDRFIHSRRFAIPIGKEADIMTWERFTSDSQRIYSINQISLLQETLMDIFNENIPSIFSGDNTNFGHNTSSNNSIRSAFSVDNEPDEWD